MRFELIVHRRCHASVMGRSQNGQLCSIGWAVLTFPKAVLAENAYPFENQL
jgi:hypothetical protein